MARLYGERIGELKTWGRKRGDIQQGSREGWDA